MSIIQAAKFSAALTIDDELYIWGGSHKHSVPIRLDHRGERIADIRAGNESLYALSSKGLMNCWDLGVKDESDIKSKSV